MSDDITPALTTEEWGDRAFSEEDSDLRSVAVDAQGDPSIFTVTPLVIADDGDWKGSYRVGMGDRQRIDIERRHAVAALALYGQPFGFTTDDLIGLCALSQKFDQETQVFLGYRNVDRAEFLRSLADRIAALLPP